MDDYHRARALHVIEHRAWLEKVPSAMLAEINKRKVALGKNKIRPLPPAAKRPMSSFFRFAFPP